MWVAAVVRRVNRGRRPGSASRSVPARWWRLMTGAAGRGTRRVRLAGVGRCRALRRVSTRKMTPRTIGMVRFRSRTEASCTCPASRWTVHRDARHARRRRGPRHRGADRGDGVERRRGRSMRARISSVPLGWVFVTRVGRHECGGPTARGRGPRCSPSSLGRGDRWKRPGRTTARAAARSDIAVHAASHRRRVHTHLGPCSGR